MYTVGGMKADERSITLAAALFAIAGIALLLFMSETPRSATVAEAMIAGQNSLLVVSGSAANVTAEKFSLCDKVCISVRSNGIPAASLLFSGRNAVVTGRVKEYRGNRYFEAEKIEME